MIPDAGLVLNRVLGAWAEGTGVPMAIENVGFTPARVPYVAAYDMPATPVAIDLAQQCKVYTGIYQITVSAPKGSGAEKVKRLAREVADLFSTVGAGFPGDGFTVWIDTEPAIMPGLITGEWYAVPVSFRYRIHISPTS
jgi:hypothetical protein